MTISRSQSRSGSPSSIPRSPSSRNWARPSLVAATSLPTSGEAPTRWRLTNGHLRFSSGWRPRRPTLGIRRMWRPPTTTSPSTRSRSAASPSARRIRASPGDPGAPGRRPPDDLRVPGPPGPIATRTSANSSGHQSPGGGPGRPSGPGQSEPGWSPSIRPSLSSSTNWPTRCSAWRISPTMGPTGRSSGLVRRGGRDPVQARRRQSQGH